MKKILFLLIASFLLVSSASAFMPPTHKYIFNEMINSYNSDNELYQACYQDPDLCFGGNILADLSVLFYFTDSGKYIATHQPVFCQSMLDEANPGSETVCAVGACLHQPADIESHRVMVPNAIRKTGLVNAIIHTFEEQHVDNLVLKKSPGIKDDAIDTSRWEECRGLYKRVLSTRDSWSSEVDDGTFDETFDKFLSEVEGSVTSYDTAFKGKGFFNNIDVIPLEIMILYSALMLLWLILIILLVFKKEKSALTYISILLFLFFFSVQLYVFIANSQGNAFDSFINIISPVSNLVPVGNVDAHLSNAVSNSIAFFEEPGYLIGTDASGFGPLGEADASVVVFDYIILVLVSLGLISLIYFNFRKKKSDGGFSSKIKF